MATQPLKRLQPSLDAFIVDPILRDVHHYFLTHGRPWAACILQLSLMFLFVHTTARYTRAGRASAPSSHRQSLPVKAEERSRRLVSLPPKSAAPGGGCQPYEPYGFFGFRRQCR